MTLASTLCDLPTRLAAHGERPAIVAFGDDGVDSWSYAQLSDSALRLAAGLVATGLRPGEMVALYAGNRAEWVAACLAVAAAGGVPVPLDHMLEGAELAAVLADAKCRRAFTTSDLLPRLAGHVAAPILLDEVEGVSDAECWRELLAEDVAAPATAAAGDTAILFYTSGTTGPPKGVPLSHQNLAANIEALRDLHVLGPDHRALVPLPFHHVYPFVVGLLAPLAVGATVLLPAGLASPQIRRALVEGKAMAMIGVPRLYEALYAGIAARAAAAGPLGAVAFRTLLALSAGAGHVFGRRAGRLLFHRLHRELGPQLRYVISGGAHLDAALERKLAALGWEVLTGYGLTETAAVATVNPPGQTCPGSAGLPAPGMEVRIAAPDADGIGEAQLRGPAVFAGYRNRPGETRAAFTTDGWFRTGDLGRLDRAGYLLLTARAKEMIVLSGGKNVAPEEIEGVYGASPYVAGVAVLEHEGRLVGLVHPDIEALRAEGIFRIGDILRVSLAEQERVLAPHKRISAYAISHEPLPRTRLGKLRRYLLPPLYEQASAGKAIASEVKPADWALLDNPRARRVWSWLEDRYPEVVLTPETSPQLDLGVDSLGWIELAHALGEELGIHLDEAAAARVVDLRDLLREALEAEEKAVPAPAAARALAAETIDPTDERWLRPRRPLRAILSRLAHGLVWAFARLFLRLRVEGLERLPPEGPLMIAANHLSLLDPVVLFAALPWRRLKRTCWAGDRRQVFVKPLTRLAAWLCRAFPVEDRDPVGSLAKGARVLARGETLVWFPEAWRSPTGALQPFQPGVGRLLAESGGSVVPVRIRGTFEAMPRGRRLPWPRPVRLTFGPPLTADDLAPKGEGAEYHARIAKALHDVVAALGDGAA